MKRNNYIVPEIKIFNLTNAELKTDIIRSSGEDVNGDWKWQLDPTNDLFNK